MSARSFSEEEAAALAASLIAGKKLSEEKALRTAEQSCGIRPTRALMETELRRWFHTFGREEHRAVLRRKRTLALEAMSFFSEWNPSLVGDVLSGSARDDSPIELFIRTDDEKSFELFLLSREIDYSVADLADKSFRNGMLFAIESEDDLILITVSSSHYPSKKRKADPWQLPAESAEKAGILQLKNLLEESLKMD